MYDIVILTDHRYVNPKKTNWYIDQVLLEDKLLQDSLEEQGLKVSRKDWADPSFDWGNTKYAIFRTTWDYFERFEEFFTWLEQMLRSLSIALPYMARMVRKYFSNNRLNQIFAFRMLCILSILTFSCMVLQILVLLQ